MKYESINAESDGSVRNYMCNTHSVFFPWSTWTWNIFMDKRDVLDDYGECGDVDF